MFKEKNNDVLVPIIAYGLDINKFKFKASFSYVYPSVKEFLEVMYQANKLDEYDGRMLRFISTGSAYNKERLYLCHPATFWWDEEELEINVDKEEIAKAIYRFMKKFFDNITYDLILDSCTLIKDVSKK